MARGMNKGTAVYLVHWVGFADKDATWEPLENPSGCAQHIRDFEDREKSQLDKDWREVH